MTNKQISFAFRDYPFRHKGKAMAANGTAICEYSAIQEPAELGAPVRVQWHIVSALLNVPIQKEPIRLTEDDPNYADFKNWLSGRHGYPISRDLYIIWKRQQEQEMEPIK